jgi:hypothetical protein
MTIINKYNNGNTLVTLYSDGTKEIEYSDSTPVFEFPNSIDCKITNYCNNSNCIRYCHEKSNLTGKHANIYRLLDILAELPAGVEIALGGGATQKHPDIIYLLEKLNAQGLIPNITINQFHLEEDFNIIKNIIDYVYGIGISFSYKNIDLLKKIYDDDIVFHLILGINTIDDLLFIHKNFSKSKVLLLGYKIYGNGINYYNKINNIIDNNINNWYINIAKFIGNCHLSFDNLAIEQLKLKRLFTDEGWNKFYMGNDFTQSMYIDAVEEQYAPTSRSINKISFSKYTLLEYFNEYKQR